METLDNRQPFWAISKICLNNWHYIDRKILTLSEGTIFSPGIPEVENQRLSMQFRLYSMLTRTDVDFLIKRQQMIPTVP